MKVPGTFSRVKIWRGPIPGTHEPGFVEQPIQQIEMPPLFEGYEMFGFRMGECRILLGHEPLGLDDALRWHLTISCVDRHPSWDEIKTAKYRLTGPDLTMAMILPPADEYVNVEKQDHVFQLHEIPHGRL